MNPRRAGLPSHEPPDYACPFCKLIGGEGDDWVTQDHVVERTADTITFVAPRWFTEAGGNLLVVPTEHFENLYALPDRLGAPMLRAVRRAALALRVALECEGTSTRQHNEPAGYQDVWHVHATAVVLSLRTLPTLQDLQAVTRVVGF